MVAWVRVAVWSIVDPSGPRTVTHPNTNRAQYSSRSKFCIAYRYTRIAVYRMAHLRFLLLRRVSIRRRRAA